MIGGKPHKVQELELVDGSRPFASWFSKVKDPIARVKIRRALDRIEIDGYFGDFKSLKEGIFEIRFYVGPGYRVYFGMDGARWVILIGGGDKSTQGRDIAKAQALWALYKNEKKGVR